MLIIYIRPYQTFSLYSFGVRHKGRKREKSPLGTGLTLDVLPQRWDERTFAPTSATTQIDPVQTFGANVRWL
jgi:hypothetical protein